MSDRGAPRSKRASLPPALLSRQDRHLDHGIDSQLRSPYSLIPSLAADWSNRPRRARPCARPRTRTRMLAIHAQEAPEALAATVLPGALRVPSTGGGGDSPIARPLLFSTLAHS